MGVDTFFLLGEVDKASLAGFSAKAVLGGLTGEEEDGLAAYGKATFLLVEGDDLLA